MATWALSLIPIMAMSVRIVFTSHDHRWSVGYLPYLFCHLASCASASVSGSLVSSSRPLMVEPNFQLRGSSHVRVFFDPTQLVAPQADLSIPLVRRQRNKAD
jgi:hypothetical protein